jgi:hypothetical protein
MVEIAMVRNRVNAVQLRHYKNKKPPIHLLYTGTALGIGYRSCLCSISVRPDIQLIQMPDTGTGYPAGLTTTVHFW